MPSSTLTKEGLAAKLKQQAAALGFDLAGLAAAGDADPQEHYQRWLAKGFHGGMAYLAQRPEFRRSPAKLLPGCRSVIVVAKHYPAPGAACRTPAGVIAAYALGRDYHNVIKKGLKKLAAWLRAETGGGTYVETDTGPVLEKAWAARAGLGFAGKNTCLITPGGGSFLLLGVCLTTAELAVDEPRRRDCGRCRVCIDACPTGALSAPHELNANRCLSYLNIENRGVIPPELAKLMGERVFGCDLCQEVCPYNSHPAAATEHDFLPRPWLGELSLASLVDHEPNFWESRWRGMALARPGWGGWLRNALAVWGNNPQPEYLPLVKRLAEHSDPIIAQQAKLALK